MTPQNTLMGCTDTDISTCWGLVQRKKIVFRMDYILRADLGLREFDGRSGSRVARNTKPSRVILDYLSILSFTDQVKQATNTATSVRALNRAVIFVYPTLIVNRCYTSAVMCLSCGFMQLYYWTSWTHSRLSDSECVYCEYFSASSDDILHE